MVPFTPLPPRRVPEPFDDPDWLYELKYDGFRALAFVERKRADLVSRNGNRFTRFAPLASALRASLRVRSAVLDGEVVCLDRRGRPQFNELLFGRGTPVFVAFDVLALNGHDLRALPLLRRKALLRRVIPGGCDCVLYAKHIAGDGSRFFSLVCAEDLEGVVAKWKQGTYAEPSSWVKVKNPSYTAARDRWKLMG